MKEEKADNVRSSSNSVRCFQLSSIHSTVTRCGILPDALADNDVRMEEMSEAVLCVSTTMWVTRGSCEGEEEDEEEEDATVAPAKLAMLLARRRRNCWADPSVSFRWGMEMVRPLKSQPSGISQPELTFSWIWEMILWTVSGDWVLLMLGSLLIWLRI